MEMFGLESQVAHQPPQKMTDYPTLPDVFAEIQGSEGGALIKRGLGIVWWADLVTNFGRKEEYSTYK